MKQFYCPICGFAVHAWGAASLEVGPRESMHCPHCGGTSRNRAIARAVLVALGEGPSLRDVAEDVARRGSDLCVYEVGASVITPWLAKISPGFVVSELTARGRAIAQNIENLTLPSDVFDLVICSEVLEHVRLWEKGLRELARVLKPGGKIILTVPLHHLPNHHRSWCAIEDPADPAMDVWATDPPRHIDPLDSAGCPVYRIFGSSLLMQQMSDMGIPAHIETANVPENGIVNCAVFVGEKTAI